MKTTETTEPVAKKVPVTLTESQAVTVDELKHVRKHVKVLKAREVELSTEVKGIVRGTAGAVDKDGVLVASVSDRAGRRTVDMARLATDFPDAYAACVALGNASEVLVLH